MEIRIGDAERDAATARLGDHFAEGRLDHEEYDERLDAIWSARTRADLDQLFWDLPRTSVPVAPRPVPVAARRHVPVVPVLVILLLAGMAVAKAAPWLLVIGLVWLVFLRPGRSHAPGRHGRTWACR